MSNKLNFKAYGLIMIIILSILSGYASFVQFSRIKQTSIKTIKLKKEQNDVNPIDFQTQSTRETLIQQIPFSGFTQNRGQIDPSIIFYYNSPNASIGFGTSKISIINGEKNVAFTLMFPNSNSIRPNGLNQLSSSINYFIGNRRLVNLRSFSDIWYYNLYDHIDLHFFMSPQGLKYEFIVHPGGNPNRISIQVSNQISLEVYSNHVNYIAGNNQILSDQNLRVFQESNFVSASFITKGNQIYGYNILSYDHSKELTIDPLFSTLAYSTYIGGNATDMSRSIAIDNTGNVYITGQTYSLNFPTINGYNLTYIGDNSSSDIFITKLNPSGNGLIYSTFIGGTGNDVAYGIKVDNSGDAYITGYTFSHDFPTTSSISPFFVEDAFVLKLNPSGNSLIYSTYIGGTGGDQGIALTLDSLGNTYVTGITNSPDFPKKNAYNSTLGKNGDIFVLKLNNTGTGIDFSTYIGGNMEETPNAITLDNVNNIYITGITKSPNFPTKNAYNSTIGSLYDAFVLKLNSSGNGLVFSTFLGGNKNDFGQALTVDKTGDIYVLGYTESPNFPTKNAYNSTFVNWEAFLVKLNPAGNTLLFSTYLGPMSDGIGLALDNLGNIYVTGFTASAKFPVIKAYDPTFNKNYDTFILKFDPANNRLLYSTFFGGSGNDNPSGLVIDNLGDVYVTGITTTTTGFPTKNAYQSSYGGGNYDAFVLKLTIDLTAPTINNPNDISYIENQTGNIINWTVSDLHPGVYNVTADGSIFKSDTPWTNGTISVNVDGLSIGDHIVKIYVYDNFGNSVSDAVIVTVTTNSNNSSSNKNKTPNNPFLLPLLIIGGILILIVVTVIYYKRRKNLKK